MPSAESRHVSGPPRTPTLQSVQSDHERADALLGRVEDCGDPRLRAELRSEAVVLTLDLVDSVARRYQGRGVDLDDLVQVGRVALLKAAHGYRADSGNSFAAYAVPTIAGEIKRHFRDHGWLVRPPRRLQELRAELAAGETILRHELMREPSEAELARTLGLEPSDVRAVRVCAQGYRAVSLDLPGGGSTPEPRAEGQGLAEGVVDRESLARALHGLTERERLIIRLRFVEEHTQSQIGSVLGVSQMQVSRLLSSIVTRLRHELVEAPDAA